MRYTRHTMVYGCIVTEATAWKSSFFEMRQYIITFKLNLFIAVWWEVLLQMFHTVRFAL